MPKSPAKPSPIYLAVLAALAAPAWAQQADKPPADKTQLETVTVTAERRSENIKDVPNSVTAIKGELLDALNSGGQDVRMLAGRAPSLNIESSFGRAFPRFYIRGFGNSDFDLNASQPVSLVLDDVVQESPLLKGFPMFDVEQIEVVRGPQGTLFGRNSPAGVVKFDSVKPSQLAESYVNLGLGSFSAANLEGAINAPINAQMAVRLSMQVQHRDDWVDNTAPNPKNSKLEGYDDNALRAQFLYAPDKSFSALFNLHGRKLEGTARLFRANIIQPGTNNLVPGFDEEKISIDGRNEQNLDSFGGNLRLKWDWGSMALTSITGYEKLDSFSRGDIDGGFGASFAPPMGPGFIPFPAESADGMPKHKQLTQEFRLESRTGGAFSWLVGAYYFNEDVNIDSFNYDTLAGGVQNGYAWQKQENTAWALYGSANMVLGGGWSVRGGVRYTKDEKDFSAQRTQSPIGGGATGVLTASPSDNDTSGDLSVSYALNKDVNLYARYARGFRAPSIQGRLLFGDTLSVAGSETVDSFEGGIKGDFWNKRARLALTAFSYEVKNQQLTAVGGATNFNTLINAAKTEGRGAEIDFQAILAENLLVTLSGSYNKTEIRDPNLRIAPCGGGCTVLDPTNGSTVSIDGNPLPNAPKNVYNFTLRYGIPLANGEAYIYTDWAYRSKINFFLYESVEFTGKPLTEGGLRVGYRWDHGKYEVAAFGRNITNEIQVIGGIDFNNLTGMINEPRTYGVQFKAIF
ncbi:TonB-dependent receptor [Usitatibacter palustris]|uniref:Vitamin B12 transporter BtuB n=1 Tax=Usitatibacter palustris TaxID=2732487 RepID=A0A6M4H759_9PROT|nr:TonB-dependent receptor [Usitatibacter palustris]QJR15471.1 Vitamin B12 transporter BtuB [Usitatibacter palustris]